MSFVYTTFEKKKVFVGFSLGRHFQSRRRLSCPYRLLKNPYICAECGFSQILALKIKPVIAKKAKENLSTHTANGYQGCQNSDKAPIDTKKEVAKLAGVSHDTIAKVETIEQQAPLEIKQAVRAGSRIWKRKGYRWTFRFHVS